MNAFEFVLVLVLLLFVLGVVRHKMGIPARSLRQMRGDQPHDQENERLREQVKQMQDRIRVLERIVTDRGAETASQIEALRDRDRLPEDQSK